MKEQIIKQTNETQQYLTEKYYSASVVRKREGESIPKGFLMTFNGVGSKEHGITPWMQVRWDGVSWVIEKKDWRTPLGLNDDKPKGQDLKQLESLDYEPSFSAGPLIQITEQHTYSLLGLVCYFKRLIGERGFNNAGLTQAYCDELLDDLRTWEVNGTQVMVRMCKICGCTNAHACPAGCSWVEPDLCSRCKS
jgi:hypothetical protein